MSGDGADEVQPPPERAAMRLAEPMAAWALFGLLTATAAPGATLFVFPAPWYSAWVVIPLGFGGALGGALYGAVDPAGWARGLSHTDETAVFRIFGVLLASAALGMVWFAAVGVSPTLWFAVVDMVFQLDVPPDVMLEIVAFGAVAGALLGTPMVVMHAFARVIGRVVGRPFRASLTATAAATLLTGVLAVLAVCVFLDPPTR